MKLSLLAMTLLCACFSYTANAGLKIYYIRHAEGGHNVKKAWEERGVPESEWPAYVGNPDAFTPRGLKEVVSATEKLKQYNFDFIATSPAWRARNTILPYLKDTKQKAEVWPELKEGKGMTMILDDDLPELTKEILNLGEPVELPEEEQAFFQLRAGVENHYMKYPREGSDKEKVAYMKHVTLHAIEIIEDRFSGSDKTILIAGHNSAGVSLMKLLIQHEPTGEARRGLNSSGMWMVEQQDDGSYKLMMYNDQPYTHQ